jgi:hypothetical protein
VARYEREYDRSELLGQVSDRVAACEAAAWQVIQEVAAGQISLAAAARQLADLDVRRGISPERRAHLYPGVSDAERYSRGILLMTEQYLRDRPGEAEIVLARLRAEMACLPGRERSRRPQ